MSTYIRHCRPQFLHVEFASPLREVCRPGNRQSVRNSCKQTTLLYPSKHPYSSLREMQHPCDGMGASDNPRLLPGYLYRSRGALAALTGTGTVTTPSACSGRSRTTLGLGHVHDDVLRQFRRGTCFDERVGRRDHSTLFNFMVPGPSETRQIPMYTGEFYAYCAVGGILSCGITHTGVTPLDVVKCNMQVHPPFPMSNFVDVTCGRTFLG